MVSFITSAMLSILLLTVSSQAASHRSKRGIARNDTKTASYENGKTITINNYITCPEGTGFNAGDRKNTGRGRQLYNDENGCPLTSYEFPQRQQVTDYIRVKTPVPDMYAGTICAWISSGEEGRIQGTLVSYATARMFNGIILLGRLVNDTTPILDVFINDEGYFTQLRLQTGRRVHFCAAFSVLDGYVKLFVDGALKQTLARFQKKMVIEGGGVFIVGQEQDGLATGFAENQSYLGTVDNFMMWDRELTAREVRSMSQEGCQCPSDYFLSLRHDAVMLTGGVAAKVATKCPSHT